MRMPNMLCCSTLQGRVALLQFNLSSTCAIIRYLAGMGEEVLAGMAACKRGEHHPLALGASVAFYPCGPCSFFCLAGLMKHVRSAGCLSSRLLHRMACGADLSAPIPSAKALSIFYITTFGGCMQ